MISSSVSGTSRSTATSAASCLMSAALLIAFCHLVTRSSPLSTIWWNRPCMQNNSMRCKVSARGGRATDLYCTWVRRNSYEVEHVSHEILCDLEGFQDWRVYTTSRGIPTCLKKGVTKSWAHDLVLLLPIASFGRKDTTMTRYSRNHFAGKNALFVVSRLWQQHVLSQLCIGKYHPCHGALLENRNFSWNPRT